MTGRKTMLLLCIGSPITYWGTTKLDTVYLKETRDREQQSSIDDHPKLHPHTNKEEKNTPSQPKLCLFGLWPCGNDVHIANHFAGPPETIILVYWGAGAFQSPRYWWDSLLSMGL